MIAAIFTAVMTLWGGMWLFHRQEKIKTDSARIQLAAALLAEIGSTWSRYLEVGD